MDGLHVTLSQVPARCPYIQAAIEQLTHEGWSISEAGIARVSPLLFKHINFLGRYDFDLPQTIAEGALRPSGTLIPNRTSA